MSEEPDRTARAQRETIAQQAAEYAERIKPMIEALQAAGYRTLGDVARGLQPRGDRSTEGRDAGAYWHRAEADDPWELVRISPNGFIFSIGGEPTFSGENAQDYMQVGEWHRLPDPPGPGEIVGDEET